MAPVEPMKLEQPGQPEPKKVTVKALQEHTAFGKSYKVGDTYEIDEAFADSVVIQGKAARVDPKAKP